MTKRIISEKEAAELKRLYKEHVTAVNRAGVMLASKGANSSEFVEADKVAVAIDRRIRKILNSSDSGRTKHAQGELGGPLE
jgi:hypothetical protein